LQIVPVVLAFCPVPFCLYSADSVALVYLGLFYPYSVDFDPYFVDSYPYSSPSLPIYNYVEAAIVGSITLVRQLSMLSTRKRQDTVIGIISLSDQWMNVMSEC